MGDVWNLRNKAGRRNEASEYCNKTSYACIERDTVSTTHAFAANNRGKNKECQKRQQDKKGNCDYGHSGLTPELSRTALRRRQSFNLNELCRRREAVSA